ncbi:MAG: DUF6036 family nucleotidyltransferase [Nanoarchaeota archaeon]|nr:DUF6036 family nucleotidyltransferase [Nanoarchaeota archaeon]
MPYNKKEINAEVLFEFIQSISGFFEEEIEMYALGGTALTILHIKPSTLDIDINIDKMEEYRYTCKIFEQIGFEKKGVFRWLSQEGMAFDLFYGSNILGTDLLPDCLDKSKYIRSFGKIKLYTLSIYDIIISKLARGDMRDFDDLKRVFEKKEIDLQMLIQRYKETMDISIVADYKQKLLDLIEIKFKEWKFSLNRGIIEEVKKWD